MYSRVYYTLKYHVICTTDIPITHYVLLFIHYNINRYDVRHLVVNDEEKVLYKKYGVTSWPTFLLLSPSLEPIFQSSGEDTLPVISTVIKAYKSFFQSKLYNFQKVELRLESEELEKQQQTMMSFPGALCVDSNTERIFICDSHHHRIISCSFTGEFNASDVIGSGRKGRHSRTELITERMS
jgi:hypothetical protein